MPLKAAGLEFLPRAPTRTGHRTATRELLLKRYYCHVQSNKKTNKQTKTTPQRLLPDLTERCRVEWHVLIPAAFYEGLLLFSNTRLHFLVFWFKATQNNYVFWLLGIRQHTSASTTVLFYQRALHPGCFSVSQLRNEHIFRKHLWLVYRVFILKCFNAPVSSQPQ